MNKKKKKSNKKLPQSSDLKPNSPTPEQSKPMPKNQSPNQQKKLSDNQNWGGQNPPVSDSPQKTKKRKKQNKKNKNQNHGTTSSKENALIGLQPKSFGLVNDFKKLNETKIDYSVEVKKGSKGESTAFVSHEPLPSAIYTILTQLPFSIASLITKSDKFLLTESELDQLRPPTADLVDQWLNENMKWMLEIYLKNPLLINYLLVASPILLAKLKDVYKEKKEKNNPLDEIQDV